MAMDDPLHFTDKSISNIGLNIMTFFLVMKTHFLITRVINTKNHLYMYIPKF